MDTIKTNIDYNEKILYQKSNNNNNIPTNPLLDAIFNDYKQQY